MNTTATDKNGNMSKSSMGVQNIEIFDFEKSLAMKRTSKNSLTFLKNSAVLSKKNHIIS